MKKRMIMMIIALVIVFGGIFGWDFFKGMMVKKFLKEYRPPAAVVNATKVKAMNWYPQLESVGSLDAFNGVEVTPQNAGQIVKILFHSGQIVHANQPLIQQDIRIDEQELNSFKASEELAKVEYRRQLALYKKTFASAQALDEARAKLQEAQADVKKTEVTIDQKTVKAPFTGKIGIRDVNLGQYLQPGDKIAPLQALNPLRVLFSMPEQNVGQIYVGQKAKVSVDAYPKKVFNGTVTAINSEVDSNTRNIEVQVTISNPQLILYPGMFADVKLLLPKKENVLTVPQTALDYNLYGDAVFVLTPTKAPPPNPFDKKKKDSKPTKPVKYYKAERRYVKVGEQRGMNVAILSGVKAGDLVVTSGQLKLQSGATVTVNNTLDMNKGQYTDEN